MWLAAAAIALLGWLVVCSTSWRSGDMPSEVLRQGLCLLMGLCLMAACNLADASVWRRLAAPLYLVALAALCAVMLPGLGHSANGAQRWLSAGPLGTVQPSEIAKLGVISGLASLLSWREESRSGWPRALGVAALMVGLPFGLILLQPDLGTALVVAAVTVSQLLVAGFSPLMLGLLGAAAAGMAPLILKPYQRARLLVFLDPEADPQGTGYNLIQSKIAVGAGGLWGVGLFAGQMTHLRYVPEQRTDFIFSAIGEELGFIGAAGFLALYAILIACLVASSLRARDLFGLLVGAGVTTLLAVHVLVNIGMSVGLVPVVGIPLPLVSHGGTAAMITLASLGVVASVGRGRG